MAVSNSNPHKGVAPTTLSTRTKDSTVRSAAPLHNGHVAGAPPASIPPGELPSGMDVPEYTRLIEVGAAVERAEQEAGDAMGDALAVYIMSGVTYSQEYRKARDNFRTADESAPHWTPETPKENAELCDDPLRDFCALFFRAGLLRGFVTFDQKARPWAEAIDAGAAAALAEKERDLETDEGHEYPILDAFSVAMIDSGEYARKRDGFRAGDKPADRFNPLDRHEQKDPEDLAEGEGMFDYYLRELCAEFFRAGQWASVVAKAEGGRS